jgi:YD repeat-containing protein
MKRIGIYFLFLITVLCIGCKEKKIPKENRFFDINENVPFERFICFPYEINIEFLKVRKIKSYILFDSRKEEDDFIFSFYNSTDSPVVYVQTGWIEEFYYSETRIDSIIYYNENDSGLRTLFTKEFYVYENDTLDSIIDSRIGNYTSFSYKNNIMIRRHQKIIPPTISIDTFFYKNGNIEKITKWNSKEIDGLEYKNSFAFEFKNNNLSKVSKSFDNLNYNLSYDNDGNLVSISAQNGGKIGFKYNAEGIMTELLMTNGEFQWAYNAKIEYQ